MSNLLSQTRQIFVRSDALLSPSTSDTSLLSPPPSGAGAQTTQYNQFSSPSGVGYNPSTPGEAPKTPPPPSRSINNNHTPSYSTPNSYNGKDSQDITPTRNFRTPTSGGTISGSGW